MGVTNTQFISASALNEDPRNQRTVLHAAETDRGPIIVDKTAIASSELEDGSKRYARSYSEGPLYAPVTGYFSSVGNASTGIEAAEEDVLDGQSQTLLGQRTPRRATTRTSWPPRTRPRCPRPSRPCRPTRTTR